MVITVDEANKGQRVIFLDVDGVLNDHSTFRDRKRESDIDPAKVAVLKHLVEQTGAKIVLSSSWRIFFDENTKSYIESKDVLSTGYYALTAHAVAKDLIINLAECGLKISDITPKRAHGERGNEVRQYLMAHRDIESFVILDDDTFPDWRNLTPFWVKTDFYGEGLTWTHADMAIEKLNTMKNPYSKS